MCHRFELYQTPKVIKLLEGTGFSVKEPRIFNPGDIAPVLAMDRNLKPRVFFMKWGYSIYDKLVYKSRSEDIVNRRSFSNDYMKHRCVIPATSYYEWDKKKFERGREQELFNRELLNFAQKIMDKISNDIDNNKQTPQAEMYSLMNILKNLPQIKQEIPTVKQNQKQKTLSPEHFKQIEKELFGIEN